MSFTNVYTDTNILLDHLERNSLHFSNLTNINIFISSMELFSPINVVYATFFGTSPPARACVAVDLPSSCRVRIDCLAFQDLRPEERQALHVQGLSYWAPANIGPYSQSIIVCCSIYCVIYSKSHLPFCRLMKRCSYRDR